MNSTSRRGSSMSAAQAAQQNNRTSRGEYAAKMRGEAVVNIPEPDDSDGVRAALTESLGRFDLTVGDVPGLEPAWQDRFGILNAPPIRTVTEVADDLLRVNYGRHRGGPWLEICDPDGFAESTTVNDANVDEVTDDTELILTVHTRNGAGNREHYHDDYDASFEEGCTACATAVMQDHPLHLGDADSEFDPTYANFWFKVPAGRRAALLDAVRTGPAAVQRAAAKRDLDDIVSGAVPPWRILATREDVAELERETSDRAGRVMSDWEAARVTKSLAAAATVRDVLEGRASITGPDAVSRTLQAGAGRNTVAAYKAAAAGAEFRAQKTIVERLRSVETAAEAADPVLRDYLLGDVAVEKRSYVEGTGRKRRTVQYETSPDSDFRQELNATQRRFDAAKKTYDEIVEVLDVVAADGERRTSEDAEARAWLADEGRALLWAAGWSGDRDDLPAMPDGRVVDPDLGGS